ncbi:MAG TPA: hypothetical protein VFV33_14020 [Gemmatimonadaceae bacterium]|nr:hypothetical protein [Gemmatimonadaceae bacterium]
MSAASNAPFTAQLRARPDAIRLGTGNEPVITVRVQVPEVWDTIRLDAPADTPVSVVKERALQALMPDEVSNVAGYVVKLGGVEVLDERASITDAGASHGSIFLLTNRRRRPVR